jgi:hypothetical protein
MYLLLGAGEKGNGQKLLMDVCPAGHREGDSDCVLAHWELSLEERRGSASEQNQDGTSGLLGLNVESLPPPTGSSVKCLVPS